MAQQERKTHMPQKPHQEQSDRGRIQTHGQQEAATTNLQLNIQNAMAAVDDILADVVPGEHQSSVVGGETKPRPVYRNLSSEDFVRFFVQDPGQ